jgi:flagellar export protein FliJ
VGIIGGIDRLARTGGGVVTSRLGTVLRVRKLQEDIARQGLAFANRVLADLEKDRDRRVAHYRSIRPQPHAMRGFYEFLSEQQELLLAAESIGFGEKRVADARLHVEQWREQYLSARQKVRIIEKLQARRRFEEMREELHRETKLVDDAVNTRVAALRAGGVVR